MRVVMFMPRHRHIGEAGGPRRKRRNDPGRIPFGIQLMAPEGRDHGLLSVADLVAKTVMKSTPKTCST